MVTVCFRYGRPGFEPRVGTHLKVGEYQQNAKFFHGGSGGKASACNAGDPGSIPGWEDPLEKEMATHSSTLAWKIPWMEEAGGLQSMGLQRVRHD